MELRLQKFIASMGTLSDVRNLDQFNPIVIQMEHPVLATLYTIVVSIIEPSYMGIPINATWVCLDSTKSYYRKALKLKSYKREEYDGGAELVEGLGQAWIELTTHDEIFADPQFYDNGTGGGLPGEKGEKGDKGDKGEDAVIDLAALAAAVAAIIGTPTPSTKSLRLDGPDEIVEGASANYTVNLIDGNDVTPLVATITATSGGTFITIGSGNRITAKAISKDEDVVLSASYTSGGQALTATKAVKIINAVLEAIAVTGLPTTMFEGKTAQLVVTASFNNGTTANVAASSTYVVEPSTAGTVNASGLFTSAVGNADTQFSITASYVDNGVTKTSTVNSRVNNIIATSLEITGATSVNEKASTTLVATVTRNDGTKSAVTAEWSVNPSTAGTITSAGVFTGADTPIDLSAEITASYTFEGVTVTDVHTVAVKNVAAVITPFYGVASSTSTRNAALILSLSSRGPNGDRKMNPCPMTSGPGQSYWYAYPVSYGQATFVDLSNGFEGGMDGASGDGGITLGPITVPVVIDGVTIPFYLYQSDKTNLGLTSWDVR